VNQLVRSADMAPTIRQARIFEFRHQQNTWVGLTHSGTCQCFIAPRLFGFGTLNRKFKMKWSAHSHRQAVWASFYLNKCLNMCWGVLSVPLMHPLSALLRLIPARMWHPVRGGR